MMNQQPTPRAWANFTADGNIRVWTSAPERVRELAAEIGYSLDPLYDQTALDAAVAAERDARLEAQRQLETLKGRIAGAEREKNRAVLAERERWESNCAGKRHDGCHHVATCGTVCNKCGQLA